MVDYFLIKLEVTNKSEINPDTKRPYQNFNFVVSLHKIMYNRIPLFGNQHVDAGQLKKLTLREYNYIYTGKNTDVLNFKLNFNTLFFEAIPAALGKSYGPAPRDVAAYSNKLEPKIKHDPGVIDGQPQAARYSSSNLTSTDKDAGGQRQSDPYASLAKGMHRAITDSKASMLDGELEILGDPYFLVTGGIGNYTPGPSAVGPQMTEDGAAAHNYGEVLITVNFRNPIDIDTLEKGGRFRFDSELVPFSGVYRVNEVRSTFKDGQFKQSLKILRVPGQGDAVSNPTLPHEKDPLDNITRDSSPVASSSGAGGGGGGGGGAGAGAVGAGRAGELSLNNQLNRGTPNPDSNFTAADGGLGGAITPGSTQVSGATDNLVGNTRLNTQPYGGVIPDGTSQFSQGIPIQSGGLASLQEKTLSNEALISQSGNTVGNSFGVSNATSNISGQLISQSDSIINQVSVPGSGIGEGATVSYTPATPLSSIISSGQNVTVEDVNSQQATLPTNVSSLNGAISNIGVPALSAVANIGNRAARIVNNIGDQTLSVTRGTADDILATGIKFGINPIQLSGLSNFLKTKLLDQLTSLVSNVPENTNISTARAQGVNFRSLSPSGLSKLPPTAPYTVAPLAQPDSAYIDQLATTGGVSAVARSFGTNNIFDVSQNQLSAAAAQTVINSTPAALVNPFSAQLKTDSAGASSMGSKFLAANSQLLKISGSAGSVESNQNTINEKFGNRINNGGNLSGSVVSKYGSRTKNASPLAKIMLR
jgi:hypothetical protein